MLLRTFGKHSTCYSNPLWWSRCVERVYGSSEIYILEKTRWLALSIKASSTLDFSSSPMLKRLLVLEHRSNRTYGCWRSTKSLCSFINIFKSSRAPFMSKLCMVLGALMSSSVSYMSWNLARNLQKIPQKIIHTQYSCGQGGNHKKMFWV
jgi:hypothetical protein